MTALTSLVAAPAGALAWCADDKAIVGVRVEGAAANPDPRAPRVAPAVIHCVPAWGDETSVVIEEIDGFLGVTTNGVPPPPRTDREREVRAALEVRIVDALPVSLLNSAGDMFLDVERLDALTQPQEQA